VCECVCVCVREREGVCACVRECVCESVLLDDETKALYFHGVCV